MQKNKALVDFARPLSSAKYLRMETFKDASVAGGQRAIWYPWPYVEGLTMDEATSVAERAKAAGALRAAYSEVPPGQMACPGTSI